MEDAQRTPLSEHMYRTSLNIYKAQYFSSPSDLMKSSCGWMKANIISTNVLFKRVYQLLLNDTTGCEIYTITYECILKVSLEGLRTSSRVLILCYCFQQRNLTFLSTYISHPTFRLNLKHKFSRIECTAFKEKKVKLFESIY